MENQITLPVEHVSHTAWLVAVHRAQESERPDAHFSDRLAKKLIGNFEEEYLGRFSEEVRADHWLLTVRTWQIDQIILNSLQSGVNAVLNLGAGLDTRPYRLNLSKNLKWIEADFPALISYKNETLKDETPHCELTRIAADLSDASARRNVLERVSQMGSSVLVLTEGLLGYLSEENVIELARDLVSMRSCRFWLMDVFNRSFMDISDKFWRRELKEYKDEDVQLKFIPKDTAEFLNQYGWNLQEFQSFGQGAFQLNRFPRGFDEQAFKSQQGFMESGVCLFAPY